LLSLCWFIGTDFGFLQRKLSYLLVLQLKKSFLELIYRKSIDSENVNWFPAEKLRYTVILVRPKTGGSAQLSFAPKFVGDFFSIWANFVQCPKSLLIWGKFAQIGKISPENFEFNCADSPISNNFRPKKNYCVNELI
jgi:hypothetical protein